MGVAWLFEEIQKEKKDNEWLLPLLVENLYEEDDAKIPGEDTWLTISGVPTLCPRAIVMASRMNVPMIKQTDPQSRWTMDRGSAMHSIIQEKWLGPLGWLLGGWRCSKCAHVHGEDKDNKPPFEIYGAWVTPESSVVMPKECEVCGFKNHPIDPFKYIEPWVYNSRLLVRGRTDGLLKLPAHQPEFLDIKVTLSLKSLKNHGKPWQNNVAQLHWYMDQSKCRRSRLLYVDPSVKLLEDAIVEHRINFDPKIMYKEKEKVCELREALKDKSKPIPDCPYGGKHSFGECACVEVAMYWASNGNRSVT